jgi:hypothetical protein
MSRRHGCATAASTSSRSRRRSARTSPRACAKPAAGRAAAFSWERTAEAVDAVIGDVLAGRRAAAA